MARLLVVATPIGNLNDLTPRMREALGRFVENSQFRVKKAHSQGSP